MNGPAHYVEAERLLTEAAKDPFPAPLIAAAAVHAQLAAVAVAALSADEDMPDEDFTAWDEVAGVVAAQDVPAPRPVLRTLADHLDEIR